MPQLFQSNLGRVVQVVPGGQRLQVDTFGMDPEIRYGSHKAIVTRVSVSAAVNLQILQTIGSGVFVSVFGDKPGQISLSGLAFGESCGQLVPRADDTIHGLGLMLKHYGTHRAAKRRIPVQVALGGSAFQGILVGGDFALADAASNVGSWQLTIISLPDA